MSTLPQSLPTTTVEVETKTYIAPQWRLVWWKFRRHRLALVSAAVVITIYIVALFAEFIAPYSTETFRPTFTYAPPQTLNLFDEHGWNPHVYGYTVEIDQVALRRQFVIDPAQKFEVGLFVVGEPYRLWGLFETNVHLIAPLDPSQPMYLLGADRMGRDMFSLIVHGTRVSMSIGLVGVFLSLLLGVALGGISGYYGGTVDNIIQRIIEFIRSMPTIPLWMGLAAALPKTWSPAEVYFAITIILSFIGWTTLARVVRGRFLALREEDFVMAARLDGAQPAHIIRAHMLPAFTSHIIAAVTLAIPNMILSETALSFLGLGLRPPVISWGVLLQEAQSIRAVASAPWLLIPAVAVVLTVLALNFLGDGLRDAADPYA
jgi:peptide/nickel transport system permease protein